MDLLKLESQSLLEMGWSPEEKELISRLVKHMIDYRRLIPSYLKEDILALFKMAKKLRKEYEILESVKSDFSDVPKENNQI
jgi:hypothetical protein